MPVLDPGDFFKDYDLHRVATLSSDIEGRLSYTGLKWRKTKEPLLFQLWFSDIGFVLLFMYISYFGSDI